MIDTAAKRMGMLDMNVPALLPAPDGTIGLGDLYQLLGLYRGLADDAGGPPVSASSPWIHRARRRGRR